MSYQDQWTRFHHKPTDGINPSSGNGFIYTAYAVKVGLPVNSEKLNECWELCSQNNILIRNPYKETSPFSRDECLGSAYLGLLQPYHLGNSETWGIYAWNFSPFKIPEFSLVILLKQLIQLIQNRNDRNYFWKHSLDQIYRFSFSIPLQDRHFILKRWGKFQWYNPIHLFYAGVAKVDSMLPKKSGIKWLKYGGEENKKAMVLEFPVGHPIRTKLGL